MTTEEIKIRHLTNQYLLSSAEKLTVVRDLCGVQAQFMVNAMHALKIRCSDYDESTLPNGLVKNWTIRGTVHVFAEEDLPLFKHCNNGKDYRSDDWHGYLTWQRPDGSYIWYDDGGCKQVWALTPERQKLFSHLILDAVQETPKTRDELKDLCREAGMTEIEESGMFDPWGGGIRDLCERGFMHYTVQEKKAYIASPTFTPIPEAEANLEIARRYFTHFAPATIHDAMYFLAATQKQVKDWLSNLPVKEAEADGKAYFYIENGKTYDQEIPPCLFLAGFDQLMLGYQKKESIYLAPEHLRGIFNLAGIVMPAVLLHGNVVGKWKKKNRKLTVKLFKKVGKKDLAHIKNKAETLWEDLSAIEIVNT